MTGCSGNTRLRIARLSFRRMSAVSSIALEVSDRMAPNGSNFIVDVEASPTPALEDPRRGHGQLIQCRGWFQPFGREFWKRESRASWFLRRGFFRSGFASDLRFDLGAHQIGFEAIHLSPGAITNCRFNGTQRFVIGAFGGRSVALKC